MDSRKVTSTSSLLKDPTLSTARSNQSDPRDQAAAPRDRPASAGLAAESPALVHSMLRVRRSDVLGGLIREYQLVA
jgi:hypothetical protein